MSYTSELVDRDPISLYVKDLHDEGKCAGMKGGCLFCYADQGVCAGPTTCIWEECRGPH